MGNELSPYGDFIKNNQQYGKPISEEELRRQIKDIFFCPLTKTTKDLRKTIIEELNIGFLLEKLGRPEVVYGAGNRTEKELSLTSSELGTFSALLLTPSEKKGSYPAIIGLHGHKEDNKTFRDRWFGKDLAEEGFLVIAPSFRAMGFNEEERMVSKELYLNGFTLMGLRICETLLLINYLKSIPVDRIGIMGHSGGSDVAYLTTIISQDIQALAFDMYPKLNNLCCASGHQEIHCETIPKLAHYNNQINKEPGFKVPFRKFEYKYPNGRDEVINFFKENLCPASK